MSHTAPSSTTASGSRRPTRRGRHADGGGLRLRAGRRARLPAWSPGLDALAWASGPDSQSHVEHDAPAGHAADGVEVRLDQLGDLHEQAGEAQDQLAQRLTIE